MSPVSEAVARLMCPEAFRARDEFLAAMQRLTTSTGATDTDVGRLKEQVMHLARTTGVSVARAADYVAGLEAR